ncbi:MAG: phage terminase large subunit [Pseudomonadota bacterium]
MAGEINRLIINIPPRYSKTKVAVSLFVARVMAKHPRSKVMHLSYSDALVRSNSGEIKDIIESEGFADLFGLEFKPDAKRQNKWETNLGGEFYAASMRGQITGMGAGRDEPGFQGFMVVDDPIKPEEAKDDRAELKAVNDRFHNTLRSRVAPADKTPIIIIMQRVHWNDLCGFLLTGGSGEMWHHLCLPIEILPDAEYPDEWTHGIEIKHGLEPGPLWDARYDADGIDLLREPASVFNAQYMQKPLKTQGLIFSADHFHDYRDLPDLQYRMIYADTAQKAKETSDWTVFQCWGKGKDNRAYLIDQLRLRVETPEMVKQAVLFYHKHQALTSVHTGQLRGMKIEDKVSGTSLIQIMQRAGMTAIPIPRHTDKVTRAHDVVFHLASGNVRHPRMADAPWVKGWRDEMLAFPDGVYDDQCDPTFDAVSDMCGGAVSSLDAL